MLKLSSATFDRLPAAVRRFSYDRRAVVAGIVHLSVGNFFRAHQAWYVDRLLELPGNERWGLCGVGLIDDAPERYKAASFREQDNLYTLSSYPPSGEVRHQAIGSIVDYLFAPGDPEAVLRRLADPLTRIVTMTITEGGYNQDKRTRAYLLDTPSVVAELADPRRPTSAFGFIVEGLRRRRAAGTAPFTVASCDNLRNNGSVVRSAVVSHARALDPELADWIDARVSFPNSMVDRITPAVREEDVERIAAATGVADAVPVYCEDYIIWVLEDAFCNGRPPLEAAGVHMVADVHPYELAKLRMLNASHSMLAYPGRLAGLKFVSEAVGEPAIARLLEDFMELDVIPSLPTPPGMELPDYKNLLLARFSNPALPDQLPRICGDGAVKLPLFVGPTAQDVLSRDGDHRRLAFILACFMKYLCGRDDDGMRFEPLEPNLEPGERALALDPDYRAALRMSMLHAFGLHEHTRFAKTFVEMREALAQRRALDVLGALVNA